MSQIIRNYGKLDESSFLREFWTGEWFGGTVNLFHFEFWLPKKKRALLLSFFEPFLAQFGFVALSFFSAPLSLFWAFFSSASWAPFEHFFSWVSYLVFPPQNQRKILISKPRLTIFRLNCIESPEIIHFPKSMTKNFMVRPTRTKNAIKTSSKIQKEHTQKIFSTLYFTLIRLEMFGM